MKESNYVMIGSKKYKLVEVEEKEVVMYKVICEIIPDVFISDFVSKEHNLRDGIYTMPNGVKVEVIGYHTSARLKSNPYHKLIESFVKYIEDKGIVSAKKEKISRGRAVIKKTNNSVIGLTKMKKSIVEVRPDYKKVISMLKKGASMNEVAAKTGISYSTVYRINYTFCGHKPKHNNSVRNMMPCHKAIHRNKLERYKMYDELIDPSVSITENAKRIGVNYRTLKRYCEYRGIDCGKVKAVTYSERIEFK